MKNQDQNELSEAELEQANGSGVNTGNAFRFGRMLGIGSNLEVPL